MTLQEAVAAAIEAAATPYPTPKTGLKGTVAPVARALDLSVFTLHGWKSGRRTPCPHRLADLLRLAIRNGSLAPEARRVLLEHLPVKKRADFYPAPPPVKIA